MPSKQATSLPQDVLDNINIQQGAITSRLAIMNQHQGEQQADILVNRLNDQVNKVAMVLAEIDAFLGP